MQCMCTFYDQETTVEEVIKLSFNCVFRTDQGRVLPFHKVVDKQFAIYLKRFIVLDSFNARVDYNRPYQTDSISTQTKIGGIYLIS